MTSRHPIPPQRRDEYEQLVKLLMSGANDVPLVHDRADWVARSALQPGHLWRSMGLSGRDELRTMMADSFPVLFEANSKDMRWKKFLYKRLCGWPGFQG